MRAFFSLAVRTQLLLLSLLVALPAAIVIVWSGVQARATALEDGKREAMDVAVGNKVLYAKYAGTEFKVESDDLLILSQKDILAIVEA